MFLRRDDEIQLSDYFRKQPIFIYSYHYRTVFFFLWKCTTWYSCFAYFVTVVPFCVCVSEWVRASRRYRAARRSVATVARRTCTWQQRPYHRYLLASPSLASPLIASGNTHNRQLGIVRCPKIITPPNNFWLDALYGKKIRRVKFVN